MAAPSTPVINGAKSNYRPTEQVELTWTSDMSVTSSQVQVYVDGELSSTQAATSTSGVIGKTWTWTATASTLASVGSTVTVLVTLTNPDGTSAPANATFDIYDQPDVTLASPTDRSTMSGYPLNVVWSVSDVTGVSAQRVRVMTADTQQTIYDTRTVWGDYLATDARSLSLYVPALPNLENGHDYVVVLDVTNGMGLETTVYAQFLVSWTKPATPTLDSLTPDYDACTMTVKCNALPSGTRATLVRVIDGERVALASELGNVDNVDIMPPLGVQYTYEVTVTDNVTGAASDPLVINAWMRTRAWAINFGADAEECIVMHYNPDEDRRIEHGGELYHFADGGTGGGLPVYYSTTDREENGTFSWDTDELAIVDRLNTLSLRYPMGWIRDPFGHRWRAHIKPKTGHDRANVWRISLDWDAVRWEEP